MTEPPPEDSGKQTPKVVAVGDIVAPHAKVPERIEEAVEGPSELTFWHVYLPLRLPVLSSSSESPNLFRYGRQTSYTGNGGPKIRPPKPVVEDTKYASTILGPDEDPDPGSRADEGWKGPPRNVYYVAREEWLSGDPAYVYLFTPYDLAELDPVGRDILESGQSQAEEGPLGRAASKLVDSSLESKIDIMFGEGSDRTVDVDLPPCE